MVRSMTKETGSGKPIVVCPVATEAIFARFPPDVLRLPDRPLKDGSTRKKTNKCLWNSERTKYE
ncbi:hypothetical protein RvY_17835 [Ramazzottius varieornatus]|uniref:Uncharacterized protein n=1 Tax=Ramazzottius varieornatus TaxID=947166 RepID=A0A1D1W5K6_RAMVA|nr:hypothetical protein RvY_17835 [Ramazzottius varieornatus]